MTEVLTGSALANDYEMFLKQTYLEQINQMMANDSSTLRIEHDKLPFDLALELISNPIEHLSALKEAGIGILKEMHPDYGHEVEKLFTVELTGLPPKPMKKIGVADIDRLVSFEGSATAISDTEPLMIGAFFVCSNCRTGKQIDKQEEFTRFQKCDACNEAMSLDSRRCKFVNSQVVKVQESGKGKNTYMSCVITNDKDLWTVTAGKKIKITGIYKVLPWKDNKTKEVRWLRRVQVVTVENAHADDIILTKADIETIKALVDTPQFYEKMRDSIAPQIYGLEEMKEGGMLALASQGMRIPLSLFLIGDPSTGKSDIMKWCVKASHNGHETDMGDSSHVGLTVESKFDEDTKTRMAYVGLFGMADGGLAGIDEFDAIKQEDVPRLKSVLAAREINSNKAGVHDKFEARCAIIVTSNSAFGRYETGTSILENVKYLGRSASAILSRFALVFIVRDIKEAEHDEHIADRMVKTRTKGQDPFQVYYKDTEDFFGLETQRKYFYYISQQPIPTIPESLMNEFRQFYLKIRKEDMNQLVDTRYFDNVITLATARARLLQKEITLDDLKAVNQLLSRSRNSAAFDPRLQEVDGNITGGVKPKYQVQAEKNKEAQFWECFDASCIEHQDGNTYAKREDIIHRLHLTYQNWQDGKAEKYIDSALANGRIYEKHGQEKYNKI